MTKEMRDMLVDQLDNAKTPEEVDRAMAGGMKAMVDCQYKTAERVKFLRTAFFALAGAILILVVAGPDALREIIKLCKGG